MITMNKRRKRGISLANYLKAQTGELVGFLMLVLLVLIVFLVLFGTVPAGHVGIQNTFGSVSDYPLPPGMVLKAPWTGIVPMSVQTRWYWIANLHKYQSVIYVPVGNDAMPLFKDVDNVGSDGWGNVAKVNWTTNQTG